MTHPPLIEDSDRARRRSVADSLDPRGGHFSVKQTTHQQNNTPVVDETVDDDMEDSRKFETARIQVLQQERVYIQKKTFTKWCNSFLEKVINIRVYIIYLYIH